MKRFLPTLTVLLPVALLYVAGAFRPIERSRTDLQFKLMQREAESGVVVVEIDPESLQRLGVWPWPRGYHATVIEQLADAGARRIGLDIDFSSQSIVGEDAELARALAAAKGRVVLPVFRRWQQGQGGKQHLTIVQPLPRFGRNAILASINVRPESDGLVRRYPYADSTGATPGFAAALSAEPRHDLRSFYIDFSISTRSIPRLSYVDVLTGEFDPEMVKGKAVVIGATAAELGDQIAVPVSAAMPGPFLQALAYESVAQDRALQRQGAGVTLLIALALTILLGHRFETTSWRGGLLLTLTLVATVLVVAGGLEQLGPVLLDATPWVFTIAGLYGLSLVRRIDEQALGLLSQRMAIHRTETLMHHVVQSSFDAIVTFDDEGRVKTFNHAAEKMFGYSQAEAFGRPVTQLVRAAPPVAAEGLLIRATGAPLEAVGIHRNESDFPVELVVTTIDSEEDPKLVAVLRDITERKAHQEVLRHRATHDPLTGLPNRVLFVERIERELRTAEQDRRPFAVFLLDLDRFKEINDALGHPTGDQLLIEVAKRLEGPLERNETLARFGGDEFGVLLPDCTKGHALHTAQRLIDCLGTPFTVEGFALEVDTSLGITLAPEHGEDADALIRRADVAMYEAKEKRCGLVLYDQAQGLKRVRDLTIRGDLREAIESGKLSLAYQPQVEAGTDRIVGVEALARWHHPEHGFIPPDEFIALAEYTGLIHPLTKWVIQTALKQTAEWHAEGLALGVSLNLSARNLLEDNLLEILGNLLYAHGVSPADLTLEITESVIMEDPERALRNITHLRQLGVGLAVDDFGTGYSSLAYLVKLPVQELKIDKSFVMHMHQDGGSATIVRSIVELAHNLDLAVVAEGVESEEIWQQLKELGCDTGQGYHFSRPIPPKELARLIRNHSHPAPVVVPVMEANPQNGSTLR